MSGWTASLACTRADADRLVHGAETDLTVAASEVDEATGRWRLDGYWSERPDRGALAAFAGLVPGAAVPEAHAVEDRDWVVESQVGLGPVTAGRFVVVTNEGVASPPGLTRFVIPATNAFGTGHHQTTAGCLAMLDRLERDGRRFARVADIGTGTGLLAFAAHRLWPSARVLASDIDPAAVRVSYELAERNEVRLGWGPGRLRLGTAAGVDHPVIRSAAPFDLLIANILAGPLIALTPSFAASLATGGTLIMAGMMDDQQARVLSTTRRHGLRLMEAPAIGRWSVLRLVKRHGRRPVARSGSAGRPSTGEW